MKNFMTLNFLTTLAYFSFTKYYQKLKKGSMAIMAQLREALETENSWGPPPRSRDPKSPDLGTAPPGPDIFALYLFTRKIEDRPPPVPKISAGPPPVVPKIFFEINLFLDGINCFNHRKSDQKPFKMFF